MNISTLTDLEDAIKESLSTGLNGIQVVDYNERFSPPAAVVYPDTPWLLPGETFGSWNVSMKVFLIRGGRDDKTALNSMVVECINALDDFDILEVSAPQVITYDVGGRETTAFGVVLTLEVQITVEGGI